METGPQRLALRAVQRLYDGAGIHLGDAMQETWAYADGSLYLNALLRVIHPARGGRFVGAGAEFSFRDGWSPEDGDGIRLRHETGCRAAACCYRDGDLWVHPVGVDEPTSDDARAAWESMDIQAPYYRVWGPYFEQWGAEIAGWSSLRLEEGPVLRALWAENELRDRAPAEGCKGTLAILAAADDEALERKVRAFDRPLFPTVEGGRALFYSPMEGTTVIRKTDKRMTIVFPSDAEERQVRLQIRGVEARSAMRTTGDDAGPAIALMNGGVADDPNGPNLLRPDDRHGPNLADSERPPDEMLTAVSLSADREVQVDVSSASGIWMASQKWDERQNLLLYSSAHPRGPLGALSLRDLKVRDLKVPGFPATVMARLPLYWFVANANSAHKCLNVPRSLDLSENGPDAVCFRVVGRNPAETAESDIDVRIPFLEHGLRFDLTCRFEALQEWDEASIQYNNFFPEEQRYPGAWGSDRILMMAADGQRMLVDHRAAKEGRVLAGEKFRQYEGNLFVALYGGPKGSILSLSRPRQIAGARQEYILCEAWLDNHFNLFAHGDTIPAGTRWEMDLTLLLRETTNIDEDIETLGRQALEAGEL